MKKIFLLLVCLMSFMSSSVWAGSFREWLFPTQTFPSGTTMILDRMKGIIIIQPSSRSHLFDREGTSAARWGSVATGPTAIINASYFGRTEGGFVPAGHLSSYDPVLVDPAHCEKDKNLCGQILLDSLHITEDLSKIEEPTISAGPILVRAGEINPDISTRYSHRQSKTRRTILINSSRGVFFLVTKKGYTLPKITAYIVKAFGNRVTAINLDGGSSSSLWSEHPLFQISPKSVLPTFFIIK